MAGLMGAPAPLPGDPAAAAPAPAAPMPAEGATGEREPNVTPEEQQQYEEMVARGTLLIFDEKTGDLRKGIRKMLEVGDDPGLSLGETAGTIIARLEDAAAKAGVEMDPDMREQVAAEVFELVADAATQAGIHDFGADDAAFEKAFLIAADTMRLQAQASGRLSQEEAQAEFAELAEADEDGRLDEIMAQLGGQA